MSYCIEKGEAVRDAVVRIFHEEITGAIREVTHNKDPEKGFHNARKSLKKTRGLLQLIRPVLPRFFFKEQNRRLRDAGRLLSPMRDVHALRQTLSKLDLPTNSISIVFAQNLDANEQHERARQDDVSNALKKVLNAIAKEINRWPLQRLSNEMFCAGLRAIYKKARSTWKAAAKDTKPENLHEWRKKTKNLLYSLQLIERFLSKSGCKSLERADEIADCLGIDHDFFTLQEACFDQGLVRPKRDFHEVSKRINKAQRKHQKRAFERAAKLFKEKPAAWQSEAAGSLKDLE